MSTDYLNGPDEPQVNNKVKLPMKAYTLRCIEASFGRSKVKTGENGELSGNNPMLTRKWEIVAPESVKVINEEASKAAGENVYDTVLVAGIKVMDFLVLTPKTKGVVKADCARLGVEAPADDGSNCQQYVGREMMATLRTTVTKVLDEETRQPIKMPNGEDLVQYQHNIAVPM